MKASEVDNFQTFRKFVYAVEDTHEMDVDISVWTTIYGIYSVFLSDIERNMIALKSNLTVQEYTKQYRIFQEECKKKMDEITSATSSASDKKVPLCVGFVKWAMPFSIVLPEIKTCIGDCILKLANTQGVILENDYNTLFDHPLMSVVDNPEFIQVFID